MPSVSSQNENKNLKSLKSLPRQQKTAVVFLAFFAILIVVLAVFLFYTQLNKPFDYSGANSKANNATSTDLSKRDSDGDGISDYDEINVYHTSPYLEDSDSDGISDKQEIAQGTDPNCPTGQACNGVSDNLNKTASTSSRILDNLGTQISTDVTDASINNPGQEVTPDLLRRALLDDGYDKTILDQITDDELMKSYQEALNQNEANAATSTTVNQ